MTTPVKLFSANWLDSNSSISATSGANTAALYDGKLTPQWSSSGSGTGITETITIAFRSQWGNPATRQLDRILLLNTNAAAIAAQWQDAAGQWHEIPECAFSGITSSNVIVEMVSAVAARGFALSISAVNSGTEKLLGELKLCKSVADLSRALTTVSFSCTDKGGNYYLSGGQLVAWREYRKRAASLKAENLVAGDRDALMLALSDNIFVNFSADCGGDPAETAEFAQSSAPQQYYDRRTGLYSVSLELRER